MKERGSSATLLFFYLLGLLFMALLTFLPEASETNTKKQQPSKRKRKQQKQPSSWNQIKNLLTCKQIEGSQVHDPSKNPGGYSKLGSSCGSICSFRDVVHGNTRVVHRADNSPESSSVGQETGLLSRKTVSGSTSSTRSLSSSVRSNASATYTSSSRGMQFRKLSGCYECHMIVDPNRQSNLQDRTDTKSPQHPEDHPTFEECRDAVKVRANNNTKKNPRCAADGNELLRFHCTTLTCALGSRGSSSLCGSVPGCGVCTIIRHGFQGKAGEAKGVRTTDSSGRAHDCLPCTDGRRAMLVCRVIAGRVKRMADDAPPDEDGASAGSYDSVAGYSGIYSNLEDLFVFNPRAILPCFVVIYKALD
ncbi:hypothetical protein CK203_085383 [Vitis vinifera]|uniref:Uncharacterized protein n=1 Tax=Vitis vinifera TaxID=29760 RepID=A0A438E493_VITVI|nr:hypothetical protein CK203_085383 [Vitis vinifera]